MSLSRRGLVALVSAALMLVFGAASIAAFVLATQSEGGRDLIRRVAQAQLERVVRGKVHLGTLSGSFLTDLRVDSVLITDLNDSVFIATGPVRVTFDPRDLADGRIILRSAEVQRPFVAIRREFDGVWTHERLFPRSRARSVLRRRSAFGAVFLIEQTSVRDGEFALLMPWAPDSAPQALRTRAWTWSNIALDLPRGRFAYPDSTGIHLEFTRLDADESDPPFAFREVVGEVLILRDTLRAELHRFSLPGSEGRAYGEVTWGSGAPAHYAFTVESDSVALADVAWIDPAIPTEGGGRMVLQIRNSRRDHQLAEYVITQMDVRSHASRLRGQMTWGVKGSDVALRDVDLEMTPLDVRLLERFNRGPLPIPLRGRIVGRLRGRGGPLSAFVVEDATATYHDANVPGAVSRARARGTVNLSNIAYPVFAGVNLDLTEFDLRTAQALEPTLPKLNGTLAGRARVDSVWGDVRLSDADITHRDGDAPASRLRGRARLSWDSGQPVRWDLDTDAEPLSFTALARSFAGFPLRGEYEGRFRTFGSSEDFWLVTEMEGPAGAFASNLRVDNVAPHFRTVGWLRTSALDPRTLTDDERYPSGDLTARVNTDISFDSLANLTGSLEVEVERSMLNGVRVFAGTTRLRFLDGIARLDTLALETSAVDLSASGALGLAAGSTETVRFRARMDSLGGLRPWLNRPAGDSLGGAALLDAQLNGWVRDFSVQADATLGAWFYAGTSVTELRANAALRGFPALPSGDVQISADSLGVGGLSFRRARASAKLDGDAATGITLDALGTAGTSLAFRGALSRSGDTTLVRADSLALVTDLHPWRLMRPASLTFARDGFRADSVYLAASGTSRLVLTGALPERGTLDLRLNGRDVPMADVAELLQLQEIASGRADLDARFTGTRTAPQFSGDALLRGGLIRGIRLDTLRVRLRAVSDQLDVRLALGRAMAPAMTVDAVLPLRLDLSGGRTQMIADGPLRGSISADSLDLGIFESYTRGVGSARGAMRIALELGGTWERPNADGTVLVRNGVLAPPALGGVRWRGVEADVAFLGDSIALRSFSATSNTQGRSGRASLTGWLALADRENPGLDLRLTSREFNVYNQPGTAEVDLSGDLRLRGAWRAATLSGAMTADRAIIGIPELASKDVISLEGPDRFGIADTLVSVEAAAITRAPPAFIENLTIANVPITMGRDVWIRSSEANINLGGQVSVTRGRITRGPNTGQLQLAVTGPLQTVRGTYRLNLGPVQRTFTVEQGEIRFFGDPELNPSLNVSALHTVRQYSEQGVRPDVRVRVHLGGTLRQPSVELSTPDSMRVTNSDLISYLVTGGPSYEIGRDGNVSSTAARVVLGSLGSVLGGKMTGGLCDDAQLTTAGLEAYQGGARDIGGGILSGSRFNCAKQVGDRAFVRLDAGLCGVGQLVSQNDGGSPLSFGDALGLKFDYLLGRGFSASVGVEPPTSATLCVSNATNSARGFVPTPRQIGVDLFRAWRF
jgi:translocation and assembly module TamB